MKAYVARWRLADLSMAHKVIVGESSDAVEAWADEYVRKLYGPRELLQPLHVAVSPVPDQLQELYTNRVLYPPIAKGVARGNAN